MLICGDLALAGIIDMPSVEEMGRMIADLGRGAQRGLYQLGLISSSKPNDVESTDIIQAFKNLYIYLEAALTPEEKMAMSFSPLMLEHTLCKYGRFSRLSLKP